MKSQLINASENFNKGNYSTAIEIAKTIKKTSKDYTTARSLLIKAYNNLGILFIDRYGDPEASEINFKLCLDLCPHHEDANKNLANLYYSQDKIHEAIVYYQKTLKVNIKNSSALMWIGKCFERLNDLERASKYYQQYSEINPTNASCLMSDALLIKSIISDSEYITDARIRTNRELDKLTLCEQKIDVPEAFNGTYFYFSYHGICNKDLNIKIANTYLRLCPSLNWTSPHVLTWNAPSSRIKLGIISENLRQHSIGNTSSGLIAMIDRKRFEVIVIHLGEPHLDAMQDRINKSADNFVYVSKKSLVSARGAIASLNLDIAFWQDIGMNPFSYFLSFARLAPVQCTTFGHPDTTGIPNMDYFISSDLYETESSDDDYSEKLIRLPNAGTLSYYYKPIAINDFNRQDFGLSSNDKLFMCLQTLFKLHPIMDGIFNKISQLDNKAKFVFIDPVDAEMRPAFTKRAFAKYPELESKFIFIKHTKNHNRYMQLLKCADVILDPVYFNGQNTDLEAFSLNLPIVTLPSTLQRGRHTQGMYKKMGFLDLVATSSDHYAELANKLTCNDEFSKYCREEISKNKHVLYEDMHFIHNLEEALTQMIKDIQ